jgi:1-acyl-sn-glycerol-3-phosphate acyltransferase
VDQRTAALSDPLLQQRDPELIRRVFPLLASMVDYYYRGDVEGIERLSDKASLVVSTHNGGMATPDLHCLMVAFWRRFGLHTPAHGLMHQFALKLPGFGSFFVKLGAIPASPANVALALRADRPVLVCPGGDEDALKPFSQRHRVLFGKRRGFIRAAIRHQVPICPVVSVGAHETFFVLNDGRRLAEITGFAKYLRVKSVPLTFGFPCGISPAGIFSLPLPAKIRVRVLPKIELAEAPERADDARTVERCFEHVRAQMQQALDELASRRRRVVLG